MRVYMSVISDCACITRARLMGLRAHHLPPLDPVDWSQSSTVVHDARVHGPERSPGKSDGRIHLLEMDTSLEDHSAGWRVRFRVMMDGKGMKKPLLHAEAVSGQGGIRTRGAGITDSPV
jgi:hypothetical protein